MSIESGTIIINGILRIYHDLIESLNGVLDIDETMLLGSALDVLTHSQFMVIIDNSPFYCDITVEPDMGIHYDFIPVARAAVEHHTMFTNQMINDLGLDIISGAPREIPLPVVMHINNLCTYADVVWGLWMRYCMYKGFVVLNLDDSDYRIVGETVQEFKMRSSLFVNTTMYDFSNRSIFVVQYNDRIERKSIFFKYFISDDANALDIYTLSNITKSIGVKIPVPFIQSGCVKPRSN